MMKLVDEWRKSYKWLSIQLAILAGAVAGYLAANPDVTKQLLDTLPEGPARVWASAGVGLFVTMLAGGSRLVKQGKPPANSNDEDQGS